MRRARLALCFALLLPATACLSAETGEWDILKPGDVIMIQGAPAAYHFHSSPDHVKYSWMIGTELQRGTDWLAGYAYFNNSFGQKCHYLYGGKSWTLGESDSNWYVKVTAGLIEGYKDPYKDKLPINPHGIAPVIVPALGYRHDRFNVQVSLLGAQGLMATVGYDLFRR
jgi:hypothetical protein